MVSFSSTRPAGAGKIGDMLQDRLAVLQSFHSLCTTLTCCEIVVHRLYASNQSTGGAQIYICPHLLSFRPHYVIHIYVVFFILNSIIGLCKVKINLSFFGF